MTSHRIKMSKTALYLLFCLIMIFSLQEVSFISSLLLSSGTLLLEDHWFFPVVAWASNILELALTPKSAFLLRLSYSSRFKFLKCRKTFRSRSLILMAWVSSGPVELFLWGLLCCDILICKFYLKKIKINYKIWFF